MCSRNRALSITVPLDPSLTARERFPFFLIFPTQSSHTAHWHMYSLGISFCILFYSLPPPQVVEQGLEQVQAGLFAMVVTSVWAKATETPPPNASDAKVGVIGL
jgi:hypothetical protein